MAPASYAQRVIADGATNYWRLGEQSGTVARDEIGGAHGTISGGVTLGVAGPLKVGSKAMAFDGATGKVALGSPLTVTPEWTIEAWVSTATITQRPYWSNRGTGADASETYVGFSGGTSMSYGGGASLSGGRFLNDSQWHQVVLTTTAIGQPGGQQKAVFYADGALNVQGSVPSVTPKPFAANLGFDTANAEYWPGLIAEVAIYPYALTPAQVAAHYQLGLGQFGDSAPQPSTAGMPLVDKPLLDGQAVLGAGAGVDVAGCASLAFTVVGNGPVTAGAVQLEEAHDANYAGAWAAMGAPVTVAAGAKTVKLNQTAKAVRARVSTAIVGGSASVSLVAR